MFQCDDRRLHANEVIDCWLWLWLGEAGDTANDYESGKQTAHCKASSCSGTMQHKLQTCIDASEVFLAAKDTEEENYRRGLISEFLAEILFLCVSAVNFLFPFASFASFAVKSLS
jgi:hypothetical protein